jgi:hypothetical protein
MDNWLMNQKDRRGRRPQMSLGTKDLSIIEGDLVKVTSHKKCEKRSIPTNTIAPVFNILPGKIPKYQLEGFSALYLDESEIELVSYTRKVIHLR